MSVRRRPRRPEQEVWEGIRAQRVGGAHGLFSAAPIPAVQSAVSAAAASLSGSGDVDSQIDLFTCAGGAEDFTLTYLPHDQSWNVSISGVTLTNGTGYTVDGQTLSILTATDARAGETVQIQYDYLSGIPALAQDPLELNIPFQSDGWKYHEVTSTGQIATYVDPSYDDSSWSVGAAPLGIGAYTDVDGHAKATTVPTGNTGGLGHVEDFIVRRWLPAGTGIVVGIDETNYCSVYVNGTSVGGASTGGPLKFTGVVPDQSNDWLLAVYITVANGYTAGGVDIEVTGTET